MSLPTTTNKTFSSFDTFSNSSLNPWDFLIERDNSLPSKAVDYIIYFITIPALLIYIPTCLTIYKQKQLWKLSAFRLLLVQDIYESLNLVLRIVPLLVDPSTNELACKVVNELSELLWYLSLYAHPMIAGNRFVAVVYFNKYITLFSSRFTALYALAFFLLPVIQRESMTVAGVRGCMQNRGGVLLTAPSGEVMGAYAMMDLVVTAGIVGLLICTYVVILYKLRKVVRTRKIVVQPSKSLDAGAAALNRAESLPQNGQSGVVTAPQAATTEPKKSGAAMGSQEIKLTFHFILVTAVYLTTYLFWIISYFWPVPYSFDIFFLLSIVNFSSNAFSIIIISREIREYLIKFYKCKN